MKSESDLVAQLLLTCAVSRQTGHEIGNFLHNMDLAVHGLKNERLSPKGEKILRLLADENARIKAYMRYCRPFFRTPKVSREMHDIENILENACGKCRGKNHGIRIQTNCIWPPRAAMGLVNRELLEKAIGFLLECASASVPDNPVLEIRGHLGSDTIIVAIVFSPNTPPPPEKMDVYGAFTKDGHLSKLFVAKTVIEAHEGTLCCRENTSEKQAFEISLPLYRQDACETPPGKPESQTCP